MTLHRGDCRGDADSGVAGAYFGMTELEGEECGQEQPRGRGRPMWNLGQQCRAARHIPSFIEDAAEPLR